MPIIALVDDDRSIRPAPEGSLHCATSRSNATPRATNLAALGTHQFQGIKQVFEGFNSSGAKPWPIICEAFHPHRC
jgi:hypothetical protein